ncbi:hypothetical protein PAALTS15_15351 [Paenibacillus alvei TS-15]|uniref:Uncharacterized protein n=1 Tax=Paenibacillus alvei TS-15 TaxID=1117108 RepID=S9TWD8_PAEAL|nr:hypothetical protein [Paenibacillus alvei]EPY06536.1 hypothetical protein PAALTS15_15351 [Paenibacillus alvei TS-15]
MIRPIAVVVSNFTNLDEQRSRASGNFSTKWFGECKAMTVEVTVDGEINNDIKFNMTIDISNGNDDTKYFEVKNGAKLEYYSSNTFYISSVQTPLTTRKEFKVTLYPA